MTARDGGFVIPPSGVRLLGTVNPPPWPLRFFAERTWFIRVCWRIVTGRFFVFRDVPTWVVIRCCNTDVPQINEAASAEILLRMKTLDRDLDHELRARNGGA